MGEEWELGEAKLLPICVFEWSILHLPANGSKTQFDITVLRPVSREEPDFHVWIPVVDALYRIMMAGLLTFSRQER